MVNENTSNTVVAILYCIYAVLLLAIGLYVSNKMTLKQKRYQERCHRAETVHRNVIMGFMENNCLERHLLRQVTTMKELGVTGCIPERQSKHSLSPSSAAL